MKTPEYSIASTCIIFLAILHHS
uniref:Uncharacterized protein n=1 Tax=Anguilla anguilla TaxID=7936 RepID=A0A0E9W955_ANGAN